MKRSPHRVDANPVDPAPTAPPTMATGRPWRDGPPGAPALERTRSGEAAERRPSPGLKVLESARDCQRRNETGFEIGRRRGKGLFQRNPLMLPAYRPPLASVETH